MHAANIASHGRVARVSGLSLGSLGRLRKGTISVIVIGAIATYIARLRRFAFYTRDKPCFAA